jgi:lipoate-protein ligase A
MSAIQPVNSLAPCRLLVDGPAAGAWQMAVDEVLLESAAERGVCTLRFYGWSEPTLSLGYFQGYSNRAAHRASRDCACVRRQTGGGAILHDMELTYSLAVPVAHPLAEDVTRLYKLVHDALIRTLGQYGLNAYPCFAAVDRTSGDEPFLCFQRRAVGDVLLGESKVCGSAQRRRRGAILQHGSLLLAQSEKAPELPGILELTGKRLGEQDTIERWQRELAGDLGVTVTAGRLTEQELDAVRSLTIEKYSAAAWTERR